MSPEASKPASDQILTRAQAVAIVAGLLVALAVVLWLANAWFESFAERAAATARVPPQAIASTLAGQLRTIGLVNAGVLAALALYLGASAVQALRIAASAETHSPLERVRRLVRAPMSARTARWMLGAAGVLVGIGLGVAISAWRIAERVEQGGRLEFGAPRIERAMAAGESGRAQH